MVVIPVKPVFKFTLYYYKEFTTAPFMLKAFSFSSLGGKLDQKRESLLIQWCMMRAGSRLWDFYRETRRNHCAGLKCREGLMVTAPCHLGLGWRVGIKDIGVRAAKGPSFRTQQTSTAWPFLTSHRLPC